MTPIYHVTHCDHLPSIVSAGGLRCDRAATALGLCTVSIAHAHIKERRGRTLVPLGPKGALADYVPFYFAPRSPMLFTISRGNVEGYDEGQEAIVYLVASAEAIAESQRGFVFTDGHATVAMSAFFDDLASLDQVDWQIMGATYWNDTIEDGDRTRRRQAEFLVHDFVPWTEIVQIGVMTARMADRVTGLLVAAAHRPAVTVQRGWYY